VSLLSSILVEMKLEKKMTTLIIAFFVATPPQKKVTGATITFFNGFAAMNLL
jgi:hypothetical protein